MNYNKDENVPRYALGGDEVKLLEREKERERERESEREIEIERETERERLGYRDPLYLKKPRL